MGRRPQRVRPACSRDTKAILPRALAHAHFPAFTPSRQTLWLERSRGSRGPALWDWGWTRKPQAEAQSSELSHANDMQNCEIRTRTQLHDWNPRLQGPHVGKSSHFPSLGGTTRSRKHQPSVNCPASPQLSDVPGGLCSPASDTDTEQSNRPRKRSSQKVML